MELANQRQDQKKKPPEIRIASRSDAANIMDLLQFATRRHIHVDWYLPTDWIGAKTFLVQVQTEVGSDVPTLTNRLFDPKIDLQAAMAITAEPLPAAWVRLAAVKNDLDSKGTIKTLMDPILVQLKEAGVTAIGWLAIESWPNQWLGELGFVHETDIVTYRKTDVTIPKARADQAVEIRPVETGDFERLAEIEKLAFTPLWRHSADALKKAQSQAFSFDVAVFADHVVGFQLSARGQHGVHLARLTVDPSFQGQGIGFSLLSHAFAGYHKSGLYEVSLNTPANNQASKILYEKFGFVATQDIFPVWVMNL